MSKDPRHYYKELRLQQFRGLMALARWQTFSAAAAALKLSRASVWQQVHALEKEFGCSLVRTRAHRVELTAEGHKLVELVSPLVEGFDSVKTAFEAARSDLPKTLAIATTPTCLAYELREPIEQMRRKFPDVHLTFVDRNSPAAIDLLEHGEADVAVAARLDEWPERPSLEYLPFTAYPFTLIAPPGHELLKKKKLGLGDFAAHPLILPGKAANCRLRLEERFGRAGMFGKLNVVLECNFPVVLFEYVSSGLGVALTPLSPILWRNLESAAGLKERGVKLRDVSDLFGQEPIYYVRRR
ncbi:MAG TPA: LysR family transcriptional regulator, partial [Roseimicrobium sp.]|nr:LysR family transcriptional regulator [Roseimicrobium sp.]